MGKILSVGTVAPDFKLPARFDKTISLSELKGKPVVLAFYPADWSPVCSDEVALLNEALEKFNKHQAKVIGISVDNHWSHAAFAERYNIQFPLLADFEPKGKVAKQYGVYREKEGVCERAVFVIDKEGKIAWNYLSPIGEVPKPEPVLEALGNLS